MCRPFATGSKQASSTIRALWRGGNPGGPPGALRRSQEAGQPRALVAAADPPDRRGIVLGLGGQGLNRFPGGNAQDDPRPLDLEPGERPTTGDVLQDRGIMGNDLQGTRFSTTHGATPVAEPGYRAQRTDRPHFLALLRARD